VPTVDLLNRPWRAVVRLESERDYDRVAAELHATLRINQSSTGARRALRRGLAYTPMVSARIERMRRPPSFVVTLP
jgi:hypothetical protein